MNKPYQITKIRVNCKNKAGGFNYFKSLIAKIFKLEQNLKYHVLLNVKIKHDESLVFPFNCFLKSDAERAIAMFKCSVVLETSDAPLYVLESQDPLTLEEIISCLQAKELVVI